WSSIDVTGLVTGNFDKVRWYGMLLKLDDETADDFQSVYSRQEEESEDLAPYLELTVDLGQASNVYMCPVAGDVYLDEESCDNNFDHKTRIMVASNTINHYGLGRGLIKFEIPAGIAASQIDNATVYMTTTDSTGDGGDVNLCALNAVFNEDNATWNSVGTGAYDTESMASGPTPGTNSTTFAINVTGLLQNKLDKVRASGTMLLFDDEYQSPSVHENIYTREAYGTGTAGPYLKIEVKPTLVTLASLEAQPASNSVTVSWETESEIDNAGFNIYRAEAGGEYSKINDQLIPAQGNPAGGATYSFVDNGARNRSSYTYMLEDVDLNGIAVQHGPLAATPRLWYLFK
ncbi:MAG: DNRLRE domain-containing protein, partial [Deltaproteobacteria bacterium]|nr:DNRLRE domain-containing protein [Deltaproteobacteria bacterium]